MKTLTEKRQLTIEEQTKKNRENKSMRALFDKYTGKTEGLQVLTPNKTLLESGWNNHGLFQVTSDDPVYVHPDQKGVDQEYVRVIYYGGEHVALLHKRHFK